MYGAYFRVLLSWTNRYEQWQRAEKKGSGGAGERTANEPPLVAPMKLRFLRWQQNHKRYLYRTHTNLQSHFVVHTGCTPVVHDHDNDDKKTQLIRKSDCLIPVCSLCLPSSNFTLNSINWTKYISHNFRIVSSLVGRLVWCLRPLFDVLAKFELHTDNTERIEFITKKKNKKWQMGDTWNESNSLAKCTLNWTNIWRKVLLERKKTCPLWRLQTVHIKICVPLHSFFAGSMRCGQLEWGWCERAKRPKSHWKY